MNFFEMRWPILDPDRTRAELMAEAAGDLAHELPLLGLRALSAPVYSWVDGAAGPQRHRGPMLIARLAVSDVPALGRTS